MNDSVLQCPWCHDLASCIDDLKGEGTFADIQKGLGVRQSMLAVGLRVLLKHGIIEYDKKNKTYSLSEETEFCKYNWFYYAW